MKRIGMEMRSMIAVKERINQEGMIRIPSQFVRRLGLSEGVEVVFWTEAQKLVLAPVPSRKRLRIEADIVDELVEYEERFEPEVA